MSDWEYIAKQEAKVLLEDLNKLRGSGVISRDEFKRRKPELLGA